MHFRQRDAVVGIRAKRPAYLVVRSAGYLVLMKQQTYLQTFETDTTRPPFCWLHFQMRFLRADKASASFYRSDVDLILLSCVITSWTWRPVRKKETESESAHTSLLDDDIKWKHFPHYWPFVRGIHRWPVNSPHKGQWRGALMLSLSLYKKFSKQ